MLQRFISVLFLLIFTQVAWGQSDPWMPGDSTCPVASDLHRYIDVPMVPDLKALGASVENIPGLNLHDELRTGNENKKWRIYFELLKPYDPKKEILIVVPGGPGGPHTILHSMEELLGKSNVLNRYNIIAMDHRGVGCSRHLFPHDPPMQSYKMRFAAADIEEIRRSLGGENAKISLFGGSYGTMLGQTYALLFPKNLSRLLLNSAFSSYKDFVQANASYESLLLDWDPGLRAKFEQLRTEAPALVNEFLHWSLRPMYSYFGRTKNIPAKLDEVLNLALQKDIVGARAAVKSEDWVMDTMMRAIACQELFPIPPQEGFHMFRPQFAACAEFQPFLDYMDYTPYLNKITARTFLLGGEFDHVTPGFAMRTIAAQLPNHFMYLDPHVGHNIFEKLDCARSLLHGFFNDLSNAEMRRLTMAPACTALPVAPAKSAAAFRPWPGPRK